MFLKYGGYQHDDGETTINIVKEGLFTENRVQYAIRERWAIEGRLQIAEQGSIDANQDAMKTAIDALKTAYDGNENDLGFYHDDGGISSHFMDSSASNGGTKVVQPVSFPEGKAAEYSTFRNYSVVVEAEFPFNDVSALLLWTETLTFWGGGPEVGHLEPIVGLPQKQLLRQATTYKAGQNGRAIGLDAYPLLPGPMWPAQELRHLRRSSNTVPSTSDGQRIVTWDYMHESVAPLNGFPTEKPIN